MPRKVLIICVDGLGPQYLEAAPTPHIDRLAATGTFTIGRSVVPSVTNVNNVSIITGVPPAVHGITSNYWLDAATGEEGAVESAEFILAPTVLQRAQAAGLSTALLTSKKKLLRLLDAGAGYALSAEEPDAEIVQAVGEPEGIYSPGINPWLFRALRYLLRERNPDVVYCSTTDGIMHKYAPEEKPSIEHISELDRILGRIVDENPHREIYLTADHGMSAKRRGVDLERALAAGGVEARAIPIIKDRYVAHHGNMGGASYVHLRDLEALPEAIAILGEVPGVESVYVREEAAARFALMPERIGDIFVLADGETVFGTLETVEEPVSLRSHGSVHESAVPILAYGAPNEAEYRHNFDVVANLGL